MMAAAIGALALVPASHKMYKLKKFKQTTVLKKEHTTSHVSLVVH
jgi:hypothetical protein